MKNIFLEVVTAPGLRVSRRWLGVIADDTARKLLEVTAAVIADMGRMETDYEYSSKCGRDGVLLRQIALKRRNAATGRPEPAYLARIVGLDEKIVPV